MKAAAMHPPRQVAALLLVLCAQVGSAAALPPGGTAGPAATPRLLRIEPPRDSARHLGDLLVYRALVEWPAGWEIDTDGLAAPSREDGPLEIRSHRVERAREHCGDCRWLSVTWQLFRTVHMTSDVWLPATPLRLRKGTQLAQVLLPPARLAVSPLVPWERRADWVNSMRPGWSPRPLDVRARLVEAAGWLGALATALIGWAWSSGRWVPRRNHRPFAAAWRQAKSRARIGAGEVPQADAEDLRCWHRAFDATAGEVVFADRLEGFFAAHPVYAPLAGEVREVFAASLRTFYLARGAPGTRLAVEQLVALLRQLADLEFSPLPARRLATRRTRARV